ncbi:MAG: ketoacyl-ACP synthase III, partial [Pseudopedobacter sp.]|nr:ketoacyl-ACP synthase III [Deinococcales bacterium]
RLGFPRERVYSNLETRGNCVAASIPLALVEAWEAGKLEGHQKVLLVGTAAGLMLGGVLLEL